MGIKDVLYFSKTICLCLGIFLFCSPFVYASNTFTCPQGMNCPDELAPKIEFWVKILTQYDQNQIIFYNEQDPRMILSVRETTQGCSKQNPVFVEEKERLENWIELVEKPKNDFTQTTTDDLPASWIELKCQRGLKSMMKKAFARFKTYQPMISAELEKAYLPKEIQYLPFIESAYNPKAGSYAGAMGIWQFMSSTAKLFGLKNNAYMDERMDPFASTKAAIRYLQYAFECIDGHACSLGHHFEDDSIWPFAMTSYNYGIGGVKNAISSQGMAFHTVLEKYNGRRFGHAVKNYYASFLAAVHVGTQEHKYFGSVDPLFSQPMIEITLKDSLSLPAFADDYCLSMDTLKALNPKYKKAVWQGSLYIPKGYTLIVPLQNTFKDLVEVGVITRIDEPTTDLSQVKPRPVQPLPYETPSHTLQVSDHQNPTSSIPMDRSSKIQRLIHSIFH